MSPSDAASSTFRPEIPRRVHTDIPNAPRAGASAPATDTPEPKTMIVGRDIFLNGEITACDRLVVEGQVEAEMTDTRMIEIAETGLVKGAAEIEEADIRGRYEGKLTVRGRLLIRGTGLVTGEIRYGQLEVERGGRVSGDVDALPEAAETAAAAPAAE
ncbi:MAG: polymer-forming cytoskeletal protein [Minwuiales bacterium]|nr:polymer-forming cytoskeletal protein [Minwuiales bacterium]